jgi:hypothetical protein
MRTPLARRSRKRSDGPAAKSLTGAAAPRRGKAGPGQAEKAALGFIMLVSGRRHPAAGISGKFPVFFQPAPLPPGSIRLVSVENGKIHVKFPVSGAALCPAGAGGLRPPARPLPRGVQRSTCLCPANAGALCAGQRKPQKHRLFLIEKNIRKKKHAR